MTTGLIGPAPFFFCIITAGISEPEMSMIQVINGGLHPLIYGVADRRGSRAFTYQSVLSFPVHSPRTDNVVTYPFTSRVITP